MLEKKFDLQNFKHAQNKASEYFKEKDIHIPHSVMLNALSVFMGYKDWHTLKPLLNKDSPKMLSLQHAQSGLKVYIYRRKDLDSEAISSLMKKHFPDAGNNGLFSDSIMSRNVPLENHYYSNNLENVDIFPLKKLRNIGMVDPDINILKGKWQSLNTNYNSMVFLSYDKFMELRKILSQSEFLQIKEIAFLNTEESNLPLFS